MNKPIRTLSIFCLLLFLALMLNATYLQYYRADGLGDDPRNRRVIEAAFSAERGAILVGREPVAESVESDDQYEWQRTYDQPFKYAHTTGWFSYFSQTGVERSQNDVLSGDDSLLFVTRLADLLTNASPKGGSVQLTIDQAAQDAAWEGLTENPALGSGQIEASVVALEPATGKILAMVSTPSFDPNRLADHDLRAVAEAAEELEDAPGQPLLNRAVQTTLPPGSTFKIVTAAAALESGNYSGADALVPGGDRYQLPLTSGESNVVTNGGRACGTDRIPMRQAMEQSCNTTFAALADEVGAEDMQKQAEAFGWNSRYLEDLPSQAPSRYPDDLDAPQTALAGFGQGSLTATPLQMAMVAAGVANGGVVMRPYVVDEVRSPELDVLEKTEPTELSRAVSPETASALTEMLVSTVSNGTASPAAIPGVQVAGKTGTAQSGVEGQAPYAWFVSFAPADDPQVAVAVMIQRADIPSGEIAGGALGGPIAKRIMEAVIR
ncbi:peptidoglycan D,D-transpeptidase FtsI family protein [Nocardioides sp. GCM10027113]|uniref:peptidoglycan D,D-transpeptidase FtsI family protein n=1 Tax=unclassified Nocardioides TaxID=2615069 RepID=UPI00361AD387